MTAEAITISVAKIDKGAVQVKGSKAAPLAPITWEGAPITATTNRGAFRFATTILPPDCVGELADGVAAIDVVIEGCGPTPDVIQGPPGPPGADGAPGKDATPADFAGEPTVLVAPNPGAASQCVVDVQFCTGGNGWFWQNYANGYQPVGFWKDRGGVVHLEGVAQLTGGVGGALPSAVFILPEAYRPTALREFTIRAFVAATGVLTYVDIRPDGFVFASMGGGGALPLDGISFRP
jgi:hypothetical protein